MNQSLRQFRIEDGYCVDESGMRVGVLVCERIVFQTDIGTKRELNGLWDIKMFDERFKASARRILDFRGSDVKVIAEVECESDELTKCRQYRERAI